MSKRRPNIRHIGLPPLVLSDEEIARRRANATPQDLASGLFDGDNTLGKGLTYVVLALFAIGLIASVGVSL